MKKRNYAMSNIGQFEIFEQKILNEIERFYAREGDAGSLDDEFVNLQLVLAQATKHTELKTLGNSISKITDTLHSVRLYRCTLNDLINALEDLVNQIDFVIGA